MFQPVAIAPSILSADFMNLGRDIRMIEQAGAGYVHVDVMDGHFVPNLTMGVPVVKQLAKLAKVLKKDAFEVVVDLHLGTGTSSIYTCDLSLDYVHINADYTT